MKTNRKLYLKKLLLSFLTFHNVCAISKFGNNSIDANMGRKYQFELFEDFIGCAAQYQKERNVLEELYIFRNHLYQAKNQVLQLIQNKSINQILLIAKRNKVLQNMYQESIRELAYEFPRMADFMGSVKAMFILHHSYDFDIKHAVQEGKITFKNYVGLHKEYQVRFGYPTVRYNTVRYIFFGTRVFSTNLLGTKKVLYKSIRY